MKKIFTLLLLFTLPFCVKSQDLQNSCWETFFGDDTVGIVFSEDLFTIISDGDTIPISTFSTSLDTFRIMDIDMDSECDSTGTYTFSIEDGELNFEVLEDQCDERVDFIDGLVFYPCGTFTFTEEIPLNSVNIYPNPVTDHFVIHTDVLFDRMELVDQLGRTIKTVTNKEQVSVAELKGNLFFLRCIQGDKMLTKKILKI